MTRIEKLEKLNADIQEQILSEYKAGKRSILVQMPSGTGLTTLIVNILKKSNRRKRHILAIVHTNAKFNELSRLLSVSNTLYNASAIDSLQKDCYIHICKGSDLCLFLGMSFDTIIVDECHHMKSQTYSPVIEKEVDCDLIIGVTPTPKFINVNNQPFFDSIVVAPKLSELINNGLLLDVDQFLPTTEKEGDLNDIEMSYHEKRKRIEGISKTSQDIPNIVEAYNNYIKGKRTILFAPTIEASCDYCQQYLDAGIPAKHIDGDTSEDERKLILDDFKSGKILVITNCDTLDEYSGLEFCEAVQLVHCTASLIKYLHQTSFCFKPCPEIEKKKGFVLDHVRLSLKKNLGLCKQDRIWSLDGTSGNLADSSVDYFLVTPNGIFNGRNIPDQAIGMYMAITDPGLKYLISFEDYLEVFIQKNHQVTAPLNKLFYDLYRDREELLDYQIDYIVVRMNLLGYDISHSEVSKQNKKVVRALKAKE